VKRRPSRSRVHVRAEASVEVVVGIDATLITAHSDKQDAAPTYKRGFGFHPLLAYRDHGEGGTGTPLAGLLRAGNANAGTAAYTHAFLQTLADRTIGHTVGFYARASVAAAFEAEPDIRQAHVDYSCVAVRHRGSSAIASDQTEEGSLSGGEHEAQA
jgi:hypothetical protein